MVVIVTISVVIPAGLFERSLTLKSRDKNLRRFNLVRGTVPLSCRPDIEAITSVLRCFLCYKYIINVPAGVVCPLAVGAHLAWHKLIAGKLLPLLRVLKKSLPVRSAADPDPHYERASGSRSRR